MGADVSSARSEASEALRLSRPCHEFLLALERREVPESVQSVICNEVRFAIGAESERLQGNLRQRVIDEVAIASRQRAESLAASLHSGTFRLRQVSRDAERTMSRTSIAAPLDAGSHFHVREGVVTTTEVPDKSSLAAPPHAAKDVARSRRYVAHNFAEELREAAEQARAELDARIGIQLQNLREVLQSGAEQRIHGWRELPKKAMPPLFGIRSGHGVSQVAVEEVLTQEFCEAVLPPDDEMAFVEVTTGSAETIGNEVPEIQPERASDSLAVELEKPLSQSCAFQTPSLRLDLPLHGADQLCRPRTPPFARTPPLSARERVDISLRIDEVELRFDDLLCRLVEAAELEHQARQESELWLSGRVEESKSEFGDVLERVVCLLETRFQLSREDPHERPQGSPEAADPHGQAQGLLQLIGGAMTFASAPQPTTQVGTSSSIMTV